MPRTVSLAEELGVRWRARLDQDLINRIADFIQASARQWFSQQERLFQSAHVVGQEGNSASIREFGFPRPRLVDALLEEAKAATRRNLRLCCPRPTSGFRLP